MDAELEKVVARLEARFEAALARDDDEAAADLAVSFAADEPLSISIRKAGGGLLQLPAGEQHEVSAVGVDYLACGHPAWLISPIGAVSVLLGGEGDPPSELPDTFRQVARRWARERRFVDVTATIGETRGLLMRVSPDHLELRGVAGLLLVPLQLVTSIRLVREG